MYEIKFQDVLTGKVRTVRRRCKGLMAAFTWADAHKCGEIVLEVRSV